MSDTAFVQEKLNEIYTVQRFGSKKAAQTEAFYFLRRHVREKPLTMRRIRTFFEGTAKLVRGEEKDAVRAAQIEEARREREHLRARLDSLDALLAKVGEEFAGPSLAALSAQARERSGSHHHERSPAPERSAPAGSARRLD